jgi:hypothetical protein
MKITTVDVGLFKLPGVVLDREELNEERLLEIQTWCMEHNCGKQMTDIMWSFKKASHRDLFILHWNDQ